MGRDVDEISSPQGAGVRFVFEAKSRFAAQHNHPFCVRLVIPEPGGAGLPAGHDSLDSQSRPG
jgi:hypothetical protein